MRLNASAAEAFLIDAGDPESKDKALLQGRRAAASASAKDNIAAKKATRWSQKAVVCFVGYVLLLARDLQSKRGLAVLIKRSLLARSLC